MGILDMFENVEVPEEVEVLEGRPEDRIRERLAPILAKPGAENYYHLAQRDLNFSPEKVAGYSGSSNIMHRQFFSPVTGENFGKMGTGAIEADPLYGSGVYEYLGLLGDLRFDADAVKNARASLEKTPGINEYSVLGGHNCIDFSMDMLDEMMRQKTGEGIGWR